MSDLDLTPEQWRLARQAGAAFQADAPEADLTPYGEQLVIQGLGPQPGDLLRNVHTDVIGTVIHTETRRHGWVTIRHNNRVTTVPVRWIGEHWAPCRPDGTLKSPPGDCR